MSRDWTQEAQSAIEGFIEGHSAEALPILEKLEAALRSMPEPPGDYAVLLAGLMFEAVVRVHMKPSEAEQWARVREVLQLTICRDMAVARAAFESEDPGAKA